jgi:hypothetical protein
MLCVGGPSDRFRARSGKDIEYAAHRRIAYHRGREVGERRAHDRVQVTIVRRGQGRVRWTDNVLLAVHFEIDLYCAANYEHS